MLVTKPGIASAHAGEVLTLRVRSAEVVLHSAKPLPAAVPVWPLAPSSALGHCLGGVDQEDSGAVMR